MNLHFGDQFRPLVLHAADRFADLVKAQPLRCDLLDRLQWLVGKPRLVSFRRKNDRLPVVQLCDGLHGVPRQDGEREALEVGKRHL